jgi:SSS family solute:Na+ symporter
VGGTLSPRQVSILNLTRFGKGRMDYLVDALEVDIRSLIQDLDTVIRGGYLKRKGLTGSDYFEFELLQSGEALLPTLSEAENRLRRDGLGAQDLRMLQFLKGKPPLVIEEIAGPLSIPEADLLAAINYHTSETEYLNESGLFRRRIALSAKGEAVLVKHSDN